MPDTPNSPQQILLQWSAPSHHNHERSARWYVKGGIAILVVAAYGILTGAWSLAIVSILLGGVYFLVRRETTGLKSIAIESDGIQFEDVFTQWSQCNEFWIVQTPLYNELHVTRKTGLDREIRIQTGNIDPIQIRSTLSQFLPMKADQRERMLDAIIRLCKL